MRELVYLVATSIDGFIARPDGDFTPLLVPGDHLDFLAEEYPETFPAQARAALGIDGAPNRHFDTVLMGAATYRVPGGLPSPYPHLRQYVVSRSTTTAPDDVTVVAGDVLARVRELKAQDGAAIWLCGGSRLAGQLLPGIDRLVLKVSPVVLGEGLPLVSGVSGPTDFRATGTRSFANGVVILDYRREP